MYGKKVEYMPWGKMPIRDPTERISRVGQGFSKMLSSLKPESMLGTGRYPQTTTNASHLDSTMGGTFTSEEAPEFSP
jgi:hypothetical protein